MIELLVFISRMVSYKRYLLNTLILLIDIFLRLVIPMVILNVISDADFKKNTKKCSKNFRPHFQISNLSVIKKKVEIA